MHKTTNRPTYSPLLPFRLKLSYSSRVELSVGNEILRPSEDKRIVSNIPLRDRMVSRVTGILMHYCSLFRPLGYGLSWKLLT